jgi:hypothetical protein
VRQKPRAQRRQAKVSVLVFRPQVVHPVPMREKNKGKKKEKESFMFLK